ncbi:unnamed protein product [Cuscuta europaea]|uniref:Pectin acetylesterase n=1 Tax=Cuscuta europaea TaxID=41803 RepID=A0A9P0ZJ08_CUSEU|nr:unnamed protein product [Cuscuta europaea]
MSLFLILESLLFACFLFSNCDGSGDYVVNATVVRSDPGAVCLTGKPASYYFDHGYGSGVQNWLVYLPGGAWCNNLEYCLSYATSRHITLDAPPYSFVDILSNKKKDNPDFFNWNRVVIRYCDGSSFTSDSEKIYEYKGTPLYFRGARIYKAVMQEVLHKLGMKMAENALLVGGSAGGVAVSLHCDGFRDLLPKATRVKCFSDAGYFFPSKKFAYAGEVFTPTFQKLMAFGSIKALPEACTSRLSPHLCFFAQNVQEHIKTPIFFLMSAFDTVQVTWTFPGNDTIRNCLDAQNCPNDIIKTLQDLRSEFLSVLPKPSRALSRGLLITSPTTHEQQSNYR